MLHIVFGTDREKSRARFRVLRGETAKMCGEERVVRENEITADFLDEAASSRGLFGETSLFIFDNLFDKKAEQELLTSRARELSLSSNHFLILENSFEKGTIAVLKELATVIEEYAKGKVDTRPDFNIFSLGDALGKRNKKDLWVLYHEALETGLEPEEICGTLFWAVKNMALMKNAKTGDDCGVSLFVAQKARGFAKNYTSEEITKLSQGIMSAYHEAHRGGEPMEIALERFILEL